LLLATVVGVVALIVHDRRSPDPPAAVVVPVPTRLGSLVGALDAPEAIAQRGALPPPHAFHPVGFGEGRVRAAERFARSRDGVASFAVVDSGGVMWGRGEHELFHSASVVKSMLLAAELHRLASSGAELDDETKSVLTAMITISDNDAATEIYNRVGDEGLRDVAERAGMHDFEVADSWGYARISAADMALYFANLDDAFPRRYDKFAKSLLGSIIPAESWGIPAVADGWSTRFKGGWRETESGQLVSQAAELRRPGSTLGMAILTDGSPSMAYGIDTLEGVAGRLLGD
jgi:hypothetical protein